MEKKKLIISIALGLVLYLISTGISFAIFNSIKPSASQQVASPLQGDQGGYDVDISGPKTEACPLNGAMYTKNEKNVWDKRRPLAVMIENHSEARPQSGLSNADIIYEAVAEGGITRFMGIYYCGAAAKNLTLAPVRSARTYFVDWVSEYDALYNHVGGAGNCNDDTVDPRAKALCQIGKYNIKDMDQFGLPLKTADKKYYVCARNPDRLDHQVAYEHQMVCYTNGLYTIASERDWTNVDGEGVSWDLNFTSWKFKEDIKVTERPASSLVEFSAWKGYDKEYGVKWEYDKTTNSYKRSNGGILQTDLETKQQLTAKNIVLQFSKETGSVDEHAHLLYQTIGEGEAMILQDGKKIEGTWSKDDRTSRTKFFDNNGREIQFNRGQIWIEVLPTGTAVK
ncbi:MAG: DUF3048 domain-containing protein [Candidatus Gottesmanbacteria bacterium]